MRTSIKVTGYALGLAALFAAALGAGRFVGPLDGPGPRSGPPAHDMGPPAHDVADRGHEGGPGPGAAAKPPAGLQVTQDGYRLQPLTAALAPGAGTDFAFRVLGPDGAPVTRYTPTHERDLHLIVVRRDLSGYQHLHPALGADGTWRTPLTVPAAGQYRIFADFRPADRPDALTLGVDVPAPGEYAPTPLPAVSRTAVVDGYTVELSGDLVAGTSSRLAFRVSRDGRPVTDLQPYLGAYGHLVTLRGGDLAYLHTHADDGPRIAFRVEVPSAGAYRLYLDFKHDGAVRTAEFTATTGER